MNHFPVRPFRDHPWRRIGLSAVIAVVLHAGVLGIGAYFFNDLRVQPTRSTRLTHQKLEQALADATFHSSGVSQVTGSVQGWDESSAPSDGWTTTSFFEPAWSWWSWQATSRLSAAPVITSFSPRTERNPGSNISQP
jgi:hypothetical protein